MAILVGVAIYRPQHKLPWLLFALGQVFFVAGDVISYNYEKFFGTELPYPAISDALYLAVYPCLIAGILLIVRRRSAGRDRGGLIDAAMIAIGIGVVSWVFLISPYVHDDTLLWQEKATAMAYPLMDLRLDGGHRAAVRRWRAQTGQLLSARHGGRGAVRDRRDLRLAAAEHANGYTPGSGPLEAGWALFYILLGAAALHPSMRTVSDRQPEVDTTVSIARLAFLGGACLLAPATQAVAAARGQQVDLTVVLSATIVLFILAVVRMGGLVRQQAQSTLRERALREAGSALVTATGREQIFEATLQAARTAAGERSVVRFLILEEERLRVVAAAGGPDVVGATVAYTDLESSKRARLEAGQPYHLSTEQTVHRAELGLPETDSTVLIAPLLVRDALYAVMVVAVPGAVPAATTRTVEALSAQAALALESATLTEELLLKQSEARFASLVRNASDVVTVVEIDTTITLREPVVAAHARLHERGARGHALHRPGARRGQDARVVVPRPAARATTPSATLEFRVRRRDGSMIFAETLRTNLLHDPNVNGIVLNTRDISERKEFEEQLSHQAFHDSLTGPREPRAVPRPRDARARAPGARPASRSSVLFMDLDDFKTINDSLGHAAGDVLLGEVGERLRHILRAPDTAARLGGDEFAVLLEDSGDRIGAADVAERMIQALDGAVPPREQGGVRPGEHRDRGRAARRRRDRRRRGADAQRRRRDVHGEGAGQGPLPDVRARDARDGAAPARAQGGPAARARARRVHPALPAGDRARERHDLRRRGADPLDPPGARARPAAGLHPARRGDRADRADRAVGAAGGVPLRGASLHERFPTEPRVPHGGEPVGQAARARRRSSTTSARSCPRPALDCEHADPRDHRVA